MRVKPAVLGVRLGAHYKITAISVKGVQPLVIKVCAIHHIAGTGFWQKCVKNVHVIEFGIGDFNQ